MRLGAVLFFEKYDGPESWVRLVKKHGYRAVSTPIDETASDDEIRAYRKAAEDNDLLMAEVGVWRNTCSDDEETRKANIAAAKAKLELAEKLGARCAVNIVGERTRRCGADDLTDEAFDRAVLTVREIIDDVRPVHAAYCLETMPWMLPDSIEMYVKLLDAIDRRQAAAHCDPVNFVTSPRVYHDNGAMIREFFKQLGPRIKSCHAKDCILVNEPMPVCIRECLPGEGALDYRAFVREVNKLGPDTPLMMEHLDSDEQYDRAAAHILAVEKEVAA